MTLDWSMLLIVVLFVGVLFAMSSWDTGAKLAQMLLAVAIVSVLLRGEPKIVQLLGSAGLTAIAP